VRIFYWRFIDKMTQWSLLPRNGIGINEQANIELPGLKGLWSLQGGGKGPYDRYLVTSFLSETKVLASNGNFFHEPSKERISLLTHRAGPTADELEERPIPGFDLEKQALYCGDALHAQLLQVTEDSVRLVDGATLELAARWPENSTIKITVVSANLSQVNTNRDKIDATHYQSCAVICFIGIASRERWKGPLSRDRSKEVDSEGSERVSIRSCMLGYYSIRRPRSC